MFGESWDAFTMSACEAHISGIMCENSGEPLPLLAPHAADAQVELNNFERV